MMDTILNKNQSLWLGVALCERDLDRLYKVTFICALLLVYGSPMPLTVAPIRILYVRHAWQWSNGRTLRSRLFNECSAIPGAHRARTAD